MRIEINGKRLPSIIFNVMLWKVFVNLIFHIHIYLFMRKCAIPIPKTESCNLNIFSNFSTQNRSRFSSLDVTRSKHDPKSATKKKLGRKSASNSIIVNFCHNQMHLIFMRHVFSLCATKFQHALLRKQQTEQRKLLILCSECSDIQWH